tara:strand:+ start:2114 stop:2569 length:456 start_codon:yes stop_codon:yes gene_type:complete
VKHSALKILESVEASGDLSLESISRLIPKTYGDHRDWYIFASLVSIGYLDTHEMPDKDDPDPNRHKEQLLARKYYACSTAEKSAKYENWTWSQLGDGSLKDQKFALTGKASLYLAELRQRRRDRIFTLASGIFVGVLVAVVGAWVRAMYFT